MPAPRIVNFGRQNTFFRGFPGQTPQAQTPKSVLASLLLNRGSRLDNTRGAGIRSAGELIAGALLQKQAFEDQQGQNVARSRAQGELIKQLFPSEQGSLQLGQQFASQAPTAPSNLPETQGVTFREEPGIIEEDLPRSPLATPIGNISELFDAAQSQAQGFGDQGPLQTIPPGPGLPDVDERAPVNVPNQLGQALASINQINASQGGIDPSVPLGLFQQQQAAQQKTAREDLKFKRDTAVKVALKNAEIQSRQLISNNVITSKEREGQLNRDVKSGERVKVNVLLGNGPDGRPISRVGFSKKNDPSDIVWLGKATTAGKPSSVNVRNLPQIPAALLTGITQSNLSLKSLGRIEEIMGRVDISGFVGPIDSPIGTVMETLGFPNADQQTIGNITKDLTDALGRMRSGGVISEQEWETFQALVPQRSDNFNTFVNKLNDFKAKMNDIRAVNLDAARTFGFNTGTANVGDVESMTDEQLQAIIDGR